MEQGNKLGKSSEHKLENKTSWINQGKISLIVAVQTIVLTFLGVLSEIGKYVASLATEDFYGIPRFYFYDNPLASFGAKIIFILILIVALFYPYLMKKIMKEYKLYKHESLIYAQISVLPVLFLYLVTLDLIHSIFSFNLGAIVFWVEIGIGFALFILAIIAIHSKYKEFFVQKSDVPEEENKLKKTDGSQNIEQVLETENKIKGKNSEEDPESKEKGRNKRSHLLYAIVIVIVYLLILFYVVFGFISSLSSFKKNYEIIQDSNPEYNVIVGYHNDSAIVMKGEIKKNEDKLIITKGSYKLEKIDNRIIEYHKFKKVE
ncbi:MAG: hypothetical protein Q4A72_06640 [Bacillota bacterium]|nr:hypothetical protein [Bacillota bacterium]